MSDDIIKTEIKLSDESIHKILTAETAKALANVPGFLETIVQGVLFTRPRKRYSYDPEPPTFFEKVTGDSLKEMIRDEIKILAEENRDKLRATLKRAFKTKIIDHKEFEDRLIERLGKFTSNITFHIKDD